MRINPRALRRNRERAGLTMRMLAERSHLSVQRVSQLEAADDSDPLGGILPPTAKRLADALGVDIDDITQPEEVVS